MLCHAPIGLFFQFSDERLPHHHMGSPPGGCNVLKTEYSAIQSETVFMYFKLQMGIVILLEENFSPFLAFFK